MLAGPRVSDHLADVQPGSREGSGVLPHFAGQALGAVAALEDLKTVRALFALLCAHLALTQHRLADFRPEVTGAAVALGAVGGSQARVALMTFKRDLGFSIPPPAFVFDRKLVMLIQVRFMRGQNALRNGDTDIVTTAVARATHVVSVATLLPPATGEAARRAVLWAVTVTPHHAFLITAARVSLCAHVVFPRDRAV